MSVNLHALDALLARRFSGKVRRGGAVELSPRDDNYGRVEFLCAPVLTSHSGNSDDSAEREDNAEANKRLW